MSQQYQERPRPVVSAVILNKQNQVLLTLRSQKVWWPGKWCLPGGHLKGGQDWLAAVREEVSEEVGLEFSKAELTGIYSDPKLHQLYEPKLGKTMSFVSATFLIRDFRGEVKLNEESSEFGWFSIDALPENIFASERVKISDALRFEGQAFVR
jgi:ADP-ribose pyrophosphatase YjhB (NUDIX family)